MREYVWKFSFSIYKIISFHKTSEERVKLLRLGFDSREIERLYVKYNKCKMVYTLHIIEIIEIDLLRNSKICINDELCTMA